METASGRMRGRRLFVRGINDIVDLSGSDLNVMLYAEDVKMHTAIQNINSITVLQSGLTKFNE